MFEASNVDVSYGKSRIIQNLSLSVESGSRTAILGRNGVGKTTFLKSAIGLLPVGAGKMTFDGRDITKMPLYEIAENTGSVFQNPRSQFFNDFCEYGNVPDIQI